MGNKVFHGIPAGHESIELQDTQVAWGTSVGLLQGEELAIEASADLQQTQVPLEDERQAILTCAHAMGGYTRAGGYNRLFQISSCASPPYHPTCKMRNLEASQTQCDDAEKPVARDLTASLDAEATIEYDPTDLTKDLFGDDKAPACTYRFAALLDIAVTTAIGITGSWQYTNPLSI